MPAQWFTAEMCGQSEAKERPVLSVDQWKGMAGKEVGVSRPLKVEQERIDGFSIVRTCFRNSSYFLRYSSTELILCLCAVCR